MCGQELIEKARDGRWQVKSEEPRSTKDEPLPYVDVAELKATPDPEPLKLPPPAARVPWIRPIGVYERTETTIVEGLRYG